MRILLLVALVLLSASCDPYAGEARYVKYEPPRVTRACVDVEWASRAEVDRRCPGKKGCTLARSIVEDTGYATLLVQKPADFNDFPLVKTVGHEFLHALGANHEPEAK